jgi:DDE superfamily endonuclease
VDSPPASRVASRLSRPSTAASPHSRNVGRDVQAPRDGRPLHHPPCGHKGTARPIHRPTEPAEPQAYDRGQQKWHTRTNLLVINETSHVCFLSHPYEGQASEQRVAECAGDPVPPGSSLSQDRGVQGCSLQDVPLVHPQKTPRGGELTPPEQATNRRMSSIRIRIRLYYA